MALSPIKKNKITAVTKSKPVEDKGSKRPYSEDKPQKSLKDSKSIKSK